MCVPQNCRRQSLSLSSPSVYLSIRLESHGLWTEVCTESTVTNTSESLTPDALEAILKRAQGGWRRRVYGEPMREKKKRTSSDYESGAPLRESPLSMKL
jgi:hypothetical protein